MSLRNFGWLCIFTIAASGVAEAQTGPRQKYEGPWRWSSNKKDAYQYQRYYFRPNSAAPGYQMHYVIWYPSRPDYFYYYNPKAIDTATGRETQLYWCRALADYRKGATPWKVVPQDQRKPTIGELDEVALSNEPDQRPRIPGSDKFIADAAADPDRMELPWPPPEGMKVVASPDR